MEEFLFLEYKNCELCKSSNFNVVYQWPAGHYPHQLYETCSWDGRENIPLSIVKCEQCGLVQTRPSFKEEYLQKVYPEDIVPANEDIDKIYGMRYAKYKTLLDIIYKHVKTGTLLDIGTRYGVFPWIANESYGYDSYGLEYNVEAVKLGQQKFKNIFQGTANNLPELMEQNSLKSPDIVVLDDVLEHLVHPDRDIKILSGIQKKGSYLFLRQMDYNSLGRKLFSKNWYYFQPAAHQFYFDESSIEKLLSQNGYEVIKIYRENLLKNVLLTLSKTLKNKVLKSQRSIEGIYLDKRQKSHDDMFLVVAKKM